MCAINVLLKTMFVIKQIVLTKIGQKISSGHCKNPLQANFKDQCFSNFVDFLQKIVSKEFWTKQAISKFG